MNPNNCSPSVKQLYQALQASNYQPSYTASTNYRSDCTPPVCEQSYQNPDELPNTSLYNPATIQSNSPFYNTFLPSGPSTVTPIVEPPVPPPVCRDYGVINCFLDPPQPEIEKIDTTTPEGKKKVKKMEETKKDIACMLKIKNLQHRLSTSNPSYPPRHQQPPYPPRHQQPPYPPRHQQPPYPPRQSHRLYDAETEL